MAAETENEVVRTLEDHGYWHDDSAWRYLGDKDTNWSTIGNQQSDPIAALAEKVVNSIDARLMNECLRLGIDPAGHDAPDSMRAAIAVFFEDSPNPSAPHVGRMADWTDAKIREEARRLTLSASGHTMKDRPNITIADVGEGQSPGRVPDTFMSLDKRNKVDIHFVQGKYNMGGTGALFACGDRKMQLVVTRRNPELVDPAEARSLEWSFTVTRLEETGGRSPVFTYLAPLGSDHAPRRGDVASFPAETMPILPDEKDGVARLLGRAVPYGSFVKLYEYECSPRSNIVFSRAGLRGKLETQLPELALPVGVYETRGRSSGRSSSFTTARGVVNRVEQEKTREQLELPPIGGLMTLNGHRLKATCYAFNRSDGKARDGFLAYYAVGGGVLYTVNGQAHARSGSEFFRRSRVDLDYLRDDLLVVVDCSGVDEMTRAHLFMNSRDRHRATPTWARLEAMVEDFLHDCSPLRDLANRRREEAIRARTENDAVLSDLLGRVLSSSPDLAKLLLGGARLPSPFPRPGSVNRVRGSEFVGKRIPTFFHFRKGREGEEKVRRAEMSRDIRVDFATDAVDDYFVRAADAGTMEVSVETDGGARSTPSGFLSLRSGVARWAGALPENAAVGDEFVYRFVVSDPVREGAFENQLRVQVVARSERKGGRGGDDGGRGNRGSNGRESDGGLALPHVTAVREGDDLWATLGFEPETGLFVRHASEEAGGGFDFFFNADNVHLLRAQKERPADADLLRERFKCTLVLVGLALLQPTDAQDGDESGRAEDQELVGRVTRALAPVVLPITDYVGSLAEDVRL